jgi:hypothetical protein
VIFVELVKISHFIYREFNFDNSIIHISNKIIATKSSFFFDTTTKSSNQTKKYKNNN